MSLFPISSDGMVHTDVRELALKKNVRSSLDHTMDQGVPGTGLLATGRGPSLFGSAGVSESTEAGMGASSDEA